MGPAAISLASLVTVPSHSLLVQTYAPNDMRGGGTVNADGFGVGWWPVSPDLEVHPPSQDRPVLPVRYRSDSAMWTDTSFFELADVTRTTAMVAAVRSATTGMPVSTSACAPFAGDGWLFSHNGVVRGWPGSMAALAESVPALDLLTMEATTDSALLWALLLDRLRGGKDPADAVATLVADVLAAAPGSRLNLILADGEQIVATAVDHALSVRTGPDHAVTVASEPLDDDPAWQAVPEGSLLVARPGSVADPPVVDVTVLGSSR